MGHACAAEEAEETGWKYIHGDVFRAPPHLSLFCACVGTGTQMLAMAACICALALAGVFFPYNRGALLTACVVRPWVTDVPPGGGGGGGVFPLIKRSTPRCAMPVHGLHLRARAGWPVCCPATLARCSALA